MKQPEGNGAGQQQRARVKWFGARRDGLMGRSQMNVPGAVPCEVIKGKGGSRMAPWGRSLAPAREWQGITIREMPNEHYPWPARTIFSR